MKRIYTNPNIWVTLWGLAIFGVLWSILSPDDLVEVTSNAVMGLATAVSIRWFRPSARLFWAKEGEGYGMLTIGIFSVAFVMGFQRVNINMLRWLDRPDWLVHSPMPAFTATMFCIVLVMFLMSPDTSKGKVPIINYLWLALAVFITCIMLAFYFAG